MLCKIMCYIINWEENFMKPMKKRLAALTVAGAMLSSFTACEDHLVGIAQDATDSSYRLSGTIDFENLSHYDVVEIRNDDLNCTTLYLAKCKYEPWAACDYWDIAGTETTIANSTITDDLVISNYGEVVRISGFQDFVPLYSEIKQKYTGEEIEEIFENVRNDYSTYEFNRNKTLIKK